MMPFPVLFFFLLFLIGGWKKKKFDFQNFFEHFGKKILFKVNLIGKKFLNKDLQNKLDLFSSLVETKFFCTNEK